MELVKKDEQVVEHSYRYTLYAIFDRVALEYAPPFCAVNDGVALRMYTGTITREQADINDYKLCKVGYYDNKTGYLSPLEYVEEVVKE